MSSLGGPTLKKNTLVDKYIELYFTMDDRITQYYEFIFYVKVVLILFNQS